MYEDEAAVSSEENFKYISIKSLSILTCSNVTLTALDKSLCKGPFCNDGHRHTGNIYIHSAIDLL